MLKLIVGGIVAAASLALVSATPAHAYTVVTHDVPADTLVNLTYENFALGTFVPFAPAGAITYPLEFTTGEDPEIPFEASGLIPPPSPDENCIRAVNSVTVSFALSPTATAQGLAPTLTSGSPNEVAEDATYDYVGDGDFVPTDTGGTVVLPPSETEQAGVLTITYDRPVYYLTALLALDFPISGPIPTDWSITSADFVVTDECPDVAVPDLGAAPSAPTTAPVSSTIPVVSTLANTGSDAVPLLSASGALLLAGIAGIAVVSFRRSSRRPVGRKNR